MPKHHLHDGSKTIDSRPYQPESIKKSAPRVSLSALQWAADRAGLSYGVFTLNLTPGEELRIQAEYEKHKRERDSLAADRLAARVENEALAAEEYIKRRLT